MTTGRTVAPSVFHLARPRAPRIAALLASQRDAPFSYAEVGATRGAPHVPAPAGYAVDHNRIRLGQGAHVHARAIDALRAWRMTTLGWARVHPGRPPQEPGTTVAMVVRHYAFWSTHACRIVYAVDEVVADASGGGEVHRYGFAYGTLPAHAAAGEERFTVEWRRADDSVWYDLYAFSRPRHPLARLGHPLGRRQQRRFGRDSKRAMADAVRSAGSSAAPRRPGA